MTRATGPDMSWCEHARCKGMDTAVFFAPGTGRKSNPPGRPPIHHDRPTYDTTPLRQLCAGCPVRDHCLDHAMRYGEAGWWGGTDELERRRMRPNRGRGRRLESGFVRARGNQFT